MLEAVARARGAAAVARVEAERAGRVLALARERLRGEEFPDRLEHADEARGVAARRAADRRLVDEHDVADQLRALERGVRARGFLRLAERAEQRVVQHVLDERRLARAAHAGHADEAVQRDLDVDVLQVVLASVADLETRSTRVDRARRSRTADAQLAAQVLGRERALVAQELRRRAVEHDLPARAARPGSQVEDPIGRAHELRVVLDDEQRVAGVAQLFEHADDAVEVARVQADARLVEHEQRVHERGAERGREIDPLHLAARQRARLAIEREVAQAHVAEELEPTRNLAEHELGRLVEGLGQREPHDELARALDGQQHEVVDREARQRRERFVAQGRHVRAEAPLGREHGARVVERAEPPEQRLGLEPRARALGARVVRAVLREQHADVHLVGLRLEPGKEALHAVPLLLPPRALAVDHPRALLGRELAPRHVRRHEAQEVVLTLLVALRLPRLDRALGECLPLVRDHEPVVDADRAAEPAALLARPKRRVEREAIRHDVAVRDVAPRAVPMRRISVDARFGRFGRGCRPCVGGVGASRRRTVLPRPSAHRDVRRRAPGTVFRRVSGGPFDG